MFFISLIKYDIVMHGVGFRINPRKFGLILFYARSNRAEIMLIPTFLACRIILVINTGVWRSFRAFSTEYFSSFNVFNAVNCVFLNFL